MAPPARSTARCSAALALGAALCLALLACGPLPASAARPAAAAAAGGVAISLSFDDWAAKHGRAYSSAEEETAARAAFAASAALIARRNAEERAEGSDLSFALNAFSDLSDAEFNARYLMPQADCSATAAAARTPVDGIFAPGGPQPPAAIDWRSRGAVSPVKNQGHCGSCWTFSTTGALESAYAISAGQIYDLSEQQLVDCADAFDNKGCAGGLPSHAFEYVRYAGGLELEAAYPYTAEDGNCTAKAHSPVVFVKQSMNVSEGDEDGMVTAVGLLQPLSVAFQVADDFRHYEKGVYTSTTCDSAPDKVNHAVLAVGYGTASHKMPYWIIKNSWGADWGMDGYFEMERGKNMCGVATCSSWPELLLSASEGGGGSGPPAAEGREED